MVRERVTSGGVVSFLEALDRLADWREKQRSSITTATICARTATVRRKLRIRKSAPLVYRGLQLKAAVENRNGCSRVQLANDQERVVEITPAQMDQLCAWWLAQPRTEPHP